MGVTLLSVGGNDHKQAAAELGQAQLKLGLEPLFSFATLPAREFFLESHQKEERSHHHHQKTCDHHLLLPWLLQLNIQLICFLLHFISKDKKKEKKRMT